VKSKHKYVRNCHMQKRPYEDIRKLILQSPERRI
jgi:hypothetical protein